jgi:hypothetical protein
MGLKHTLFCMDFDTNYADNQNNCKFRIGYMFIFAHVAIAWCNQHQTCTTNFTTKFEFIAANEAIKEAILFRQLLFSNGVSQDKPTMLYTDNQNAI